MSFGGAPSSVALHPSPTPSADTADSQRSDWRSTVTRPPVNWPPCRAARNTGPGSLPNASRVESPCLDDPCLDQHLPLHRRQHHLADLASTFSSDQATTPTKSSND